MPTPPTNPPAKTKVKKTFTKEFKIQPIALAKRPGMGFPQAAADLGLNESMLLAWAKSAETEGPEAIGGHGPLPRACPNFTTFSISTPVSSSVRS